MGGPDATVDAGGDTGSPAADAAADAGDARSPTADAATDAGDAGASDAGGAGGGNDDANECVGGDPGYFGGPCTTSATCDGGTCAFGVSPACDTVGTCFYNYPGCGICQVVSELCACDGTMTYSLPCSDYAMVPSVGPFPCTDGGSHPADAGADARPGDASAE
jgi:hypothetical protein